MKSHKLFGAKPKKREAPARPEMPACIFCKGTHPGKVYMEGALLKDGKFVWRFKGVTHHACADEAREKAKAKYG